MQLRGPEPRAGAPLAVVAVPEEAQAFGDRIPTLVTGVGKVSAAMAVTWACLELRPGILLNVGTAGALQPAVVHAGAVYEIGRVLQHDLDGAAIAALLGSDPGPDVTLAPTWAVLATGDRFISAPADREVLAARAHLVDMEGYAVAAVATRLGVPVRLAKTISDDAGHGAASSWSASLAAASELLGTWLHDATG